MSPSPDPTLTFLGGAGTVTGSKYLLESAQGRILLDCGLFQGLKDLRLRNWAPLPFEARALGAVVLSHAHLDHSGHLPILAREGFRGKVFCTPGTRDLLEILLPDAARLQEEQAEHANYKGYSRRRPARPLFTLEDARAALRLLAVRPYGEIFRVVKGAEGRFRRSGHILGSASVELRWGGTDPLVLAFSGDLGRRDQPILNDPEPVSEADVLLVESTYGNRVHPPDPEAILARLVREAAERGGAILVPAFAVGRSQTLIWMLDRLRRAGRIPPLPMFLDSPMATRVSEVTCRHGANMDPDLRAATAGGECPLCNGCFSFLDTPGQSKALNRREGPFLVIAGSGMAAGGRILHHLERRLDDPRTTVLLTGFQAAGTRGRSLQEGAPQIKMHGRWIPVKARVEVLDGLSAHADREEILGWLSGFRRPPCRTWTVHGEGAAAQGLADAVRDRLGWAAAPARDGERVALR